MAISSEFYKDLSKVEKKSGELQSENLKRMFALFYRDISSVRSIFLPDLLFMVCALVTSFALGWYPVLLMMNKWKEVKRAFTYAFIMRNEPFRLGK